MFIRKQRSEGCLTYQGYVEPKGKQLLDNDDWKEDFSMQIEKEHSVTGLFVDDYKIIGFPFFNNDNRMDEFEKAIDKWIAKL
jgi:type III restriction-modification enzyme